MESKEKPTNHAADALKGAFDQIYNSGIGKIVEVEYDGQKIIGEILEAKTTRGCYGCVTFKLLTMKGYTLSLSWRDQKCTNIRRLSLEEIMLKFCEITGK